MTLTAENIFQFQGNNPYLANLGDMGDISNICQFGWYEWVYFCQKTADFTFYKEQLGRCLGTTKNEGNDMCQWVIHHNGQAVPRQDIRQLRSEESNKRADFNADIK